LDKILILGSEGFMGKYLLYWFKKNNIISENYFIDILPKKIVKKENYYRIDLLKKREVLSFFRSYKPDLIFNFVALMFSNDLKELININVMAVENLLNSINEIKDYNPKVLLIGSAAEYGFVDDSDLPINESFRKRPISNYGLSKVFLDKLAEKYVSNSNIRIYRAKPFNIQGPNMSDKLVVGSISAQIEKIRKGLQSKELHIGNLDAKRDFIDIRDAVSAFWKIINSDYIGEVFNIGSGIPYTIRKIVKTFIKYSGLKIELVQKKELARKIDPPNIYADITKIQKLLKWRPEITVEKSINDLLNFESHN